MIKNIKCIISYIITLAIITSTVAGCSRADADPPEIERVRNPVVAGGVIGDSTEVYYETLSLSLYSLSGYLPNIENAILTDSTLYFTSTEFTGVHSLNHTTRLFSADISDLDNIVPVEMKDYTTPPLSTNNYFGGVFITSMQVDHHGNLWIAESYDFSSFDFSDGFDIDKADQDEIWKHQQNHEKYEVVRRLSASGAEVLSIGLKELSENDDWLGVTAFSVCENGNIIIGSRRTIIVLDSSGDYLLTLETSGFILNNGIKRLYDGSISVASINIKTFTIEIQTIDINNSIWDKEYELTSDAHIVYQGSCSELLFFGDVSSLYTFCFDTNEINRILDWKLFDIDPFFITGIIFQSDEQLIVTHKSSDTSFLSSNAETESILTVLSTIASSNFTEDFPEPITLTMARFATDNFATNAVAHFNRTSKHYRVELIEYVDRNGDWSGIIFQEARNKFVLDVLAGKAPDIMVLETTMYQDLVGSGLFEDLYDFLDNDPELNRSDLIDAMKKTEVNGSLHQIFPFFAIGTVFGDPKTVGTEPRWNFDEFKDFMDNNPQAELIMGKFITLDGLINTMFSPEDFINWEVGTTNFDSDAFKNILEFIKSYYSENILLDISQSLLWLDNEVEQRIKTGTQLITSGVITSFADYKTVSTLFGGEIINKGNPRENSPGSLLFSDASLAILTTSNNKEGAWEFLRMFLTEDWQQRNISTHWYSLPTNRAVMARALEDSMNQSSRSSMFQTNQLTDPLTQDDVNAFLALIDSAEFPSIYNYQQLNEIIYEGIHDYLNDLISVEDAARIIQSRAMRFVSERHG